MGVSGGTHIRLEVLYMAWKGAFIHIFCGNEQAICKCIIMLSQSYLGFNGKLPMFQMQSAIDIPVTCV